MQADSSAQRLGARVMELCDDLAQWSETPQGLTCTYLSDAHVAVAARLQSLMQAAGLETYIDAVGNVVGRYRSNAAAAETIIVGSHYDTVTNAGKYDGRLGIAVGLAVIEQLAKENQRLPFHVDLFAFSDEEGVRFSSTYIGSSAIAGLFDAQLLERKDANGISMRQALEAAGHDATKIAALSRARSNVAAYLEVHIEQGPVLLDSGLPVGIVSAIAGNSRFGVAIEGVAGHAGTAPMNGRRDAATAAAEIVLSVEQDCTQPDLVGTVGQLNVPGGAINVVPGRCELSLDIRSGEDSVRRTAVKALLEKITDIAKRRNVTVGITPLLETKSVHCAARLQSAFAATIAGFGLPVRKLPSGAGHDAVMFDGITDIAMLFVRCGNGGVSHSPLETVDEADAGIAAQILLKVLQTPNLI